VAVNKMDLVAYSEEVFERIRADFADYASRLQAPDLHFIPISALKGDNVVAKSSRMPWFDGSSLLHYLETVHIASDRNLTELRFPVQCVIRPDLDFRGYAGQVASGVVRPGDPIMVLPSGRTSRVRSIVCYEGEMDHAFPPMSITVCLEDEIDISRGDMLVPPSHPPHVARRMDARIVWMHQAELEIGRAYLLKHTTQTVRAAVQDVRYRVNINSLEKEAASNLGLNDIGAVVIESQKPIFCDPYRRNRATGSFILIDPLTNATVAAGMITGREPGRTGSISTDAGTCSSGVRRITRMEQQSRSGHSAVTVWLETPPEVAFQVERSLFNANCTVHALLVSQSRPHVAELARTLNDAGVIALVCGPSDAEMQERVRAAVGRDHFLCIDASIVQEKTAEAADRIVRIIEQRGFVSASSD